MNRSRLAALSAGAMFLVASVIAPAVATADTGNTNTIKVLNAPTYNPPVSSGTFTVNIAANGSTLVGGASAGVGFDNTKLQLTAIAKGSQLVTDGASFGGWPAGTGQPGTFIANANSTGQIPNIGFFFTDGVSSEPANTDITIFTATFSIIATGDSTLTINSSPAMIDGSLGTYGASLTVTPVNGTVHNSFQPIWSLSAPSSATVLTGASSVGYTVSTSVSQGTPGAITFSATGLPSGVTAAFSPTSVTNAGSSTLTFTATAAATVGSATVVVTGTDGSGTAHSANVTLSVVLNNDFSVSATPSSISVNGGSTSSAVTVGTTVLTGTTAAIGTITLSTSALPTGITAAFTPASVSAGTSSSLTFSAGAGAVSGVTPVTISATNGTLTRATTVNLNVIVIVGVGTNVSVSGTLDSGFLGLTCPTALSIALLRGNTNMLNVPCQVYANTVWNLNVNDTATDSYKGYMVTGRPVNDASPTGPFHMADSMHVLADQYIDVAGNAAYHNNVDLSAGGMVLTGTNTASAPLVLSQFVRASTQPGSYGIQVLFSAVSVF